MSADRNVALCVARCYGDLAEALKRSAGEAPSQAGIEAIEEHSVPGAFELPRIAKFTAESGRFDGVVCLGAVIRGDTDHYEYVCSGATDGIMRVVLETGAPRGFGGRSSCRRRALVLRIDPSPEPADAIDSLPRTEGDGAEASRTRGQRWEPAPEQGREVAETFALASIHARPATASSRCARRFRAAWSSSRTP